jgi:hypothetical protein
MLYLLAQATKEDIEEGVQAALESTALSRPSEWLMFALCLGLVWLFLRALSKRDDKLDQALSKQGEHFTGSISQIMKDTAANERIARDSCHASMEKVAATHKESSDSIRTAIGGLQVVVSKLEHTADDFKLIAHDTRGMLQGAQIAKAMQEAKPVQHDIRVHPVKDEIEGMGS